MLHTICAKKILKNSIEIFLVPFDANNTIKILLNLFAIRKYHGEWTLAYEQKINCKWTDQMDRYGRNSLKHFLSSHKKDVVKVTCQLNSACYIGTQHAESLYMHTFYVRTCETSQYMHVLVFTTMIICAQFKKTCKMVYNIYCLCMIKFVGNGKILFERVYIL